MSSLIDLPVRIQSVHNLREFTYLIAHIYHIHAQSLKHNYQAMLGYCIYIAGFFLSLVFMENMWAICILTSVVGGIIGGFLWPAQSECGLLNLIRYSLPCLQRFFVLNYFRSLFMEK